MDTCVFTLNLDGIEKKFYTEKELDNFLQKYYNVLSSTEPLTENVFSKVINNDPLNKAEITLFKLKKQSEKLEKVNYEIKEGGEKVVKTLKGKSVTALIREMAEKDPSSGLIYFSTENYIKNRKEQMIALLSEPNAFNDDLEYGPIANAYKALVYQEKRGEITLKEFKAKEDTLIMPLIKKDIENWSKLAKYGSNIHKASELFFNHKLNGNGEVFTADDLGVLTELIPEERRNYLNYLNTLYTKLEHYHGGDIVALPEYKVYDEKAEVVGIIDLLVIDKNGVAHIYDFKTSYKASKDWHSAKKLSNVFQLGIYQNMLRNKGISVGVKGIIPIVMEDINYEDDTVTRLSYGTIEEIGFKDMPLRFIDRINYLIPTSSTDHYTSTKEAEEISSFLKEALDYNISLKSSLTNVDEFIKKRVKDSNTKEGEKSFIDRNTRKVISVPPEKLREAVEAYFKRDAENSSSAFMQLKHDLHNVLIGNTTLEQAPFIASSRNIQLHNAMINAFRRYSLGSWQLVTGDHVLDQLGILMFVNEQPDGKNVVEFVSFTANDLRGKISLNGRSSIIGKFLPDNIIEKYPDVLPSTNGNIELIKILAYVDANSSKFKENSYTLGRVMAFNREATEFHTENLDRLLYNFNFLCQKMTRPNSINGIKKSSKFDLLLGVFNSVVNTEGIRLVTKEFASNALSVLGGDKTDSGKLEILNNLEKDLRKILIANNQMVKLTAFDTEEKRLYAMIAEAIVDEKELPLTFESNMKEIIRLTSSPGDTTSEGANIIHGIMENAMQNIRTRQLKFARTSRAKTDKFLENQGFTNVKRNIVGNISSAYDNLFRTVDGKVDRRLILKNPYDPSSTLTPNERQYLTYFLAEVNSIRFGTSDPNSEMGRLKVSTGEWFYLPLVRGTTFNKMFRRDLGQKVKDYWDTVLDPASLFDVQKEEYNKKVAEGMYEMTNTFLLQDTPEGRDSLIESENLGAFESDLGVILDNYIFCDIRKEEYDKVLPVITAMKTAMAYQAFELGIDLSNTLNYINKQTENVIYATPHISEENKVIMKSVRALKDLTTFTNMAFNPVSGLTNFMTGFWANLSRLMARRYGKEMFGFSEFKSAFNFVFKDSVNSITSLTWLEELNMLYGLNNMDINRLADRMMQNRSGALNLSSKQLYWLMTAPDYFNRMVLFTAQMKKDGCFNAHSLVNGEMVYDFKKDTRFAVYVSGNTQNPLYNTQRALYNAMREDFNKEGYNLKEGDALPMAYNNKQRNSMKDFADSIHGHYDHATKAQYNYTVLGSLFGQFKGWMVAKKNQYFLPTIRHGKQGSYIQLEQDGIKYYRDVDGNPTTENTGDPFIVWEGRLMEGLFVSLAHILNDIKESNNKLATIWDALKDPFRSDPINPVRASNIRLMFSDLAIVLGIMLLFGLIDWPVDDTSSLSYQFTKAITRSANDLSPLAFVSAAYPSKPFASFSYVGDLYTGFWTMLMGDEKFGKYLMSNFGMTRALTPFVYPR